MLSKFLWGCEMTNDEIKQLERELEAITKEEKMKKELLKEKRKELKKNRKMTKEEKLEQKIEKELDTPVERIDPKHVLVDVNSLKHASFWGGFAAGALTGAMTILLLILVVMGMANSG